MQRKIDKFFGNKLFLVLSPIVYAIACITLDVYYAGHYGVRDGLYYLAGDIFMTVILALAAVSYFKHKKNVMKAILGVIIVGMLYDSVCNFVDWAFYELIDVETLLAFLEMIFVIWFFINHILLGINHTSKPKLVNANYIAGLLIILVYLTREIYYIAFEQTNIVYGIVYMFLIIPEIIAVLNIEANINYFKKLRDEKREAENAEQVL